MIKKTIIVNPELLPEIIKRNESDIFTIWNVAKLIDINGSGIIEVKEILNICKRLFNFQSKYVYEKLKSGIDLYWTKPHGQIRSKKICLFSLSKIVFRLQPNVTRTKPVAIPITHIEGLSTKSIKELFVSIFAARYEHDSPISISSLEKFVDKKTFQHYKKTVKRKRSSYLSIEPSFSGFIPEDKLSNFDKFNIAADNLS